MQVNSLSNFIAPSYEETKDILTQVFPHLPPESRNSAVRVCKAFKETINFIPLDENLFNSWVDSSLELGPKPTYEDIIQNKLTLKEKEHVLKPIIEHIKTQNSFNKSADQIFSKSYNTYFQGDILTKLCDSLEAVEIFLTDDRIGIGVRHRVLDIVCNTGNLEVVELLLKGKHVVPSRSSLSFTYACQNGHIDVVKFFLEYNLVNLSNCVNSALIKACNNDHVEVVKLLLQDSRVDPSADNNTALKIACSAGHLEIIKLLLMDSRVDPSADNNIALANACSAGHLEIVKLLLQDSRVDPSADNNTALKIACSAGHLEIVKLLLNDPKVKNCALYNLLKITALATTALGIGISIYNFYNKAGEQ